MENVNGQFQKPLWCQWRGVFLIAAAFLLLGWLKTFKIRSSLAEIKSSFLFVLTLTQGIKQTDHFGFICRDQSESGPSQYVCYVFQCANESLVSQTKYNNENYFSLYSLHNIFISKSARLFFMCFHACLVPIFDYGCQVDEVMLTLKQAFTTAAALQSNKTQIQLCEACPMHDLHKLCERIEGKPHALTYPALLMNILILVCFSGLKLKKH